MKCIVALLILLSFPLAAQSSLSSADEETAQAPKLSDSPGTAELLLLKFPAAVPSPFDFGQTARQKLPVFSLEGMSWTANRFTVEGMTADDPYQPGHLVALPDPGGVSEVNLFGPFSGSGSRSGPTLSYIFRQPVSNWHGSTTAYATGGLLSADNLPVPAERVQLQTSSRLRRFLNSNAQAGGRVTRWLDVFFSGTGRWASQPAPPADTLPGNLKSWDLYTTMRASIHPNAANHFDALIVGARSNDFGWSLPQALEALDGRRAAPPILPQSDLREEDHLDFVQLGWTRNVLGGDFQARYGYTTTHIDTVADQHLPASYLDIAIQHLELAYVDLASGATHGGPLLQTQSVKLQHEGRVAWRRGSLQHGGISHTLTLTAAIGRSEAENRFLNPPNALVTTVDGQPDTVTLLHSPRTTFADVGHFTFSTDDQIRLGQSVNLDLGLTFAASNGSLPAQGPPTDGRQFQFPAQSNLITWRNAAPRAAIAWQPSSGTPLVIRAGYSRFFYPLAGRYLDYGNPNGLSGDEYRWIDANQDGQFFYDEATTLLRRFGGAVSMIDPNLQPPHDDQFFASAEWKLAGGFFVRARAFRRTERDRIAALNTGVPFSAYHPVTMLDPGQDGRASTADDRTLTVYEQDPATFGEDRFLLTNPAGLRMDQRGVVAEGGFNKRGLAAQASLYVGKSWGPTNPGNDIWENDSGVVGSLYADPNTMINASGSSAMDRRFAGKMWISFSTPRSFGGLEIMNTAVFLGGYPYARRLLVTGLAQGPFMVDATPRGASRTEPVYDWNLKVSRAFEMHFLRTGTLRISAEVFNTLNLGARLRVADLTGPQFLQNLPLEMQPPRFARGGLSWDF
ncbi:MAG: hypothetical protein LAP61_21360 [Acidobacteriia bacterium]|nr:hypothetical protein [Terriglobia bacterium]